MRKDHSSEPSIANEFVHMDANKHSLKYQLSNHARYIQSPNFHAWTLHHENIDILTDYGAISQEIKATPSSHAVSTYGSINLKLKQYKQLQKSSIKLHQKLHEQIDQTIKLVPAHHDIRIRSEAEYNLLLDLLVESSITRESDDELEKKTVDPHNQTKNKKKKPQAQRAQISMEDELEMQRQALEDKIISYQRIQQNHLQAKHEELFHLRKLVKERASQSRHADSSRMPIEVADAWREIQAELELSHKILATIEPMVHHLIDSASSYLRPSTIHQIIREVDEEFRALGLAQPSSSSISNEHAMRLRDMSDYRYYTAKYRYASMPIAHVDEELKEMRQRHRQMLERIAKACQTFSPYEISCRRQTSL
jgi:hypothetical protein